MRFAAIISAIVPFLGLVAAELEPITVEGNATTFANPAALKGRAVGDLSKRGYSSWVAYHDRTTADHRAQVQSLSSQGLRPISLSISGDPSDPRYAAVWASVSGGSWSSTLGTNQADFLAWYNSHVAQGMVPTHISVCGAPGTAVYAAVMEVKNVGNWQLWIDQDAANAKAKMDAVIGHGQYRVADMALYGSGDPQGPNTRYAFIFHGANAATTQWDWISLDEKSHYLANEPAWAAQYHPPAVIAPNYDNAVSIIEQWPVPSPYQFGGAKNSADYQAYFNQMTQGGWYPYSVSVSGVGANSLYWSLWTK